MRTRHVSRHEAQETLSLGDVARLARELRVLSTMASAYTALAMLHLPRLHPSRRELEEARRAADAAVSLAERLAIDPSDD